MAASRVGDTIATRQLRTAWRARVTPRRSLFRSGLYSFIALTVPLFGALYLLGIPRGHGLEVLAVQAITVGVSLIVWAGYERAFVGVTDTELIERGFLGGLTRTPVGTVHAALLAQTYRTNAPDTVPQLLMSDASGGHVLRMRGTFWYRSDMMQIVEAVGRPLDSRTDPVTRADFFASNPQAEYWWDNRVGVLLLAVAGAGIAVTVAMLALMDLIGVPFWGG